MENMVLTLVKAVFVVYLVYSEAVNVTIFSQKDFNGQKCDIILPGCKPVCPKLVGNVVSLKAPKGTCLKFFASVDCKGTPSNYRSAYTVKAEGMPDLKGTPASEWKAIGNCSQPIGIPDNSVGLFPDKKFKGAHCVVQVSGCKLMCENVAAKSKSLITNVGCC
nr:PREDICTED: uncharacterized protein LOC109029968 [Bemisia tabaci]